MIWAPLAGTLTFLRQCSPRCSRAPLRVSPGRLDRVGQARLAGILRLEGFESVGLALGLEGLEPPLHWGLRSVGELGRRSEQVWAG